MHKLLGQFLEKCNECEVFNSMKLSEIHMNDSMEFLERLIIAITNQSQNNFGSYFEISYFSVTGKQGFSCPTKSCSAYNVNPPPKYLLLLIDEGIISHMIIRELLLYTRCGDCGTVLSDIHVNLPYYLICRYTVTNPSRLAIDYTFSITRDLKYTLSAISGSFGPHAICWRENGNKWSICNDHQQVEIESPEDFVTPPKGGQILGLIYKLNKTERVVTAKDVDELAKENKIEWCADQYSVKEIPPIVKCTMFPHQNSTELKWDKITKLQMRGVRL